MCGIAGIVSAEPEDRIEAATIHRMCDAIVHRGPDDEGIFVKDGTGLGMRRLRIIDLAGGHQPVFNEDRSVWVVFNGEIYNFPELRAELLGRGHRLTTHTDTEVIVHLYEELGADCVNKLRCIFAHPEASARPLAGIRGGRSSGPAVLGLASIRHASAEQRGRMSGGTGATACRSGEDPVDFRRS